MAVTMYQSHASEANGGDFSRREWWEEPLYHSVQYTRTAHVKPCTTPPWLLFWMRDAHDLLAEKVTLFDPTTKGRPSLAIQNVPTLHHLGVYPRELKGSASTQNFQERVGPTHTGDDEELLLDADRA